MDAIELEVNSGAITFELCICPCKIHKKKHIIYLKFIKKRLCFILRPNNTFFTFLSIHIFIFIFLFSHFTFFIFDIPVPCAEPTQPRGWALSACDWKGHLAGRPIAAG